jgi:glycosyltransferase involved in cell wall biosynthesis
MSLRVALVHDYLNQFGGAERVLEALMRRFPHADIYSLMHDPARTMNRFDGRTVHTSFLDFSLAHRYHRLFIPLMPAAIRTLKLQGQYDLILSDSAGYAKGISCPQNTFHLSYCHTPLRYAWETDTYFGHRVRARLFTSLFRPAFNYVRAFDYRAAQRPDVLVANSHFIAEKVRDYYGKDVPVVHPPVDERVFYYDTSVPHSDYFLAFGRLLHYKNFDLVLEAFRGLSERLVVAGGGPEIESLRQRAVDMHNVTFVPFGRDDNAVRELYCGARALIFPQVEDFGLVAAEAQACGTPVIAYAQGGVLEIVRNGETGVFFKEQTPEVLRIAVNEFNDGAFDREVIATHGVQFSTERFHDELFAHLPHELRLRL